MPNTNHKIVIGSSQQMSELADSTVHLMLTSPPYPMIKMWDNLFTGIDTNIANLKQKLDENFQESFINEIYEKMHQYLAEVWAETYRVLVEGGIACINIGDATRTVNGKFRVFANHSKIIEHMEKIGFTTLPYILWKKPTTKPKYKGKGAFLGSGFLPPNAYVTLDCEFILIFRKGKLRHFPPHDPNRYGSKLTKKQRDDWFTQIWTLTGSRQNTSQLERRTAAYPDEIAERLIRMFSVRGDLILDPFVGSGTTIKNAIINERNSVGYEADPRLLPLIKDKINSAKITQTSCEISITKR